MSLVKYKAKRSFEKTPEPAGKVAKQSENRFVVQEHHATNLHFDFRLEMDGVLKSWAVPKGPSLDPADKRLAMMVEDHPVEYQKFSGTIPDKNYGAGEVRIWDKGKYKLLGHGEGEEQIKAGKLIFILKGKELKGEFHMVHTPKLGENAWLLLKHKDEFAIPGWKLEPILHYGSKKEKRELQKESALDRLLHSPKRAIGNTRRSNLSTLTAKTKPSGAKTIRSKTATKSKKKA